MDWVIQHVEEMEEIPGDKVVIATQFTQLANLLCLGATREPGRPGSPRADRRDDQ